MKLINIKEFFSSKDKKTKLIIIAGVLGMILILLSELIPTTSSKAEKNISAPTDIVTDDTTEYKNELENDLVGMLRKIKGVGDVSVMLTIEGTTEYVYAEELNTTTDKDGEQTTEKYENQIVMTDDNGVKKALVKQIIKPKVSGVVVVCEGGGSTTINERVLKAVSTALNLPTDKICVECSK